MNDFNRKLWCCKANQLCCKTLIVSKTPFYFSEERVGETLLYKC